MIVFLADFPHPEPNTPQDDETLEPNIYATREPLSKSKADMLEIMDALRKDGIKTKAINTFGKNRPLRFALSQMRNDDCLLGTIRLLKNEPAFLLGQNTPWLREPLAQKRQLLPISEVTKRILEKRMPPPFFIKNAIEKAQPSPTIVKTPGDLKRMEIRLNLLAKTKPQTILLTGPAFQIKNEERCFVINKEIVARKTYFGTAPTNMEQTQKRTLVETFLESIPENYSAAIDIATIIAHPPPHLPDGTTTRIIIETNPLFCAGLYGTHPKIILRGITKKAILQQSQP
jgi:hypothetical protein